MYNAPECVRWGSRDQRSPTDGKVCKKRKKQSHPSRPADAKGTKDLQKSREMEKKTPRKDSANCPVEKHKVSGSGTKGDKKHRESGRHEHREKHQSGQHKNKQKGHRGGASRYTDSEYEEVTGPTENESATSDYYESQSEEEVEVEEPKSARSRRYEHRSK